jgi:hypothetical protein
MSPLVCVALFAVWAGSAGAQVRACYGPQFPSPGGLSVTPIVGKPIVLMEFPANDATAPQILTPGNPSHFPPGFHLELQGGNFIVLGTPVKAGTFEFHLWWSQAIPCGSTNHNDLTFYYLVTIVGGAPGSTPTSTAATTTPSAPTHTTWTTSEVESKARIALSRERAAEKDLERMNAKGGSKTLGQAVIAEIEDAIGMFEPLKDVPAADKNEVTTIVRDLNGAETTMKMAIAEEKFSPASYAPELDEINGAIGATVGVK